MQVISSDHAPYAYDKTGKLMAGKKRTFKQIPNGMPGYEARLPVVFDEMVSNGRFDVTKFVEWTSTNPAKIYGLYPKKGTLAIGSDADMAIWDPKKSVTFADKTVKDKRRLHAVEGPHREGLADHRAAARRSAGRGRQAARQARLGAVPCAQGRRGRRAARLATLEFDPKRNFGAKLR